ncbi:hypothetical protein [Phenylobacterium sp.]|uniref:hypothetical protein n=1 Tax=Phenylobacterium sp. TaxID=1871053 RepID=UPI0011FCEB88|nr:hypothetical protein [Phenylobacterium sp.]THD72556.1 MAG: hypothetical protein E8A12_00650 [Phenylobacterium sp.]
MKLAASILTGLLAMSGATPGVCAERVIALSDSEALIVPSDSPARFQRLGRHLDAHFTGRFTISGAFAYGCNLGCDAPLTERDLALYIVPDETLARRLPHWKAHDRDIRIYIDNPKPFGRKFVSARIRAALLNGKLGHVTGHATIVVDRLLATIECDTGGYSVHLIAFAKPATIGPVQAAENHGCG